MKILKVLAMGIMMTVAISGCMSEKAYMTGKVIYKGAKTVYVELPVQNEKLELMDKVVVTYDKARTMIKEELQRQERDKKKEPVSSSKAQEL